ncbi:LamG-like jellyroll fold domain-containing protein [Kitasatospora sp. NPDC088346]|uniref:LamG-like jellyroll fold domain-containing protein n=1 Tax=Kitasatospora sp. NPDC088346 TaxID=3364073 RepID=UPI003821B4F4
MQSGTISRSQVEAIDAQHAKHPATEADKAVERATATGAKVPVESLTTEFSETSATPEGHLALTRHPDQQRVRRAGVWVALDASLTANPDGSFSPKASPSGLVLSKGGNGPLATMTSPDGKKLALSAPFVLPAPRVEGDSLTYPSVAPDTDLKVTATKAGGMTTVLVLKTQSAADNPAIRNLHFATIADGVAVSTDATGNLTAKTADGSMRWFAPAPQMWDSTTTRTQPASAAKTVQGRAASAALTSGEASAPAPAADGTGAEKAFPLSSPAGPGEGAKVVAMPVTADAKGVDLKPDQDLLAHGTAPYYIDPAWVPWAPSANAWTQVQSAYPGTSYWNMNGSGETSFPGVGRCGYYAAGGSCSPASTYRTFYQFDLSGLRGAVVKRAYMDLQEYVSADWSCTTKYPVDLYHVGAISDSTTWNNQPGQIGGSLGSSPVPGSGHGACHDNVGFNYDITGTVQQYGTRPDTTTLTFGVYGNETNVNAFKRLTRQPSLYIEYDRVPGQPQDPKALPEPRTADPASTNQACGVDDPNKWAWVGAGSDQAGAVSLTAVVSSPVQAQLYSWTHLWDYDIPGAPDVDGGWSPLVANGGRAGWQVKAGAVKDGHSYGFGIFAGDQIVDWSPSTPTCHFRADLTPPTVTFPTTVSNPNTQFPPSGNGQTTTLTTETEGGIPFTAADNPGVGAPSASGLACLRWSWNPQFNTPLSNPGDGWRCGSTMPSGQITVKPAHWGTNILYVQAQDQAGNLSVVAQYAFYAPWNPKGPAPIFGDVTGDGVADILTGDGDGNLRAYTVPGNSAAAVPTPAIAARPANTPGDLASGVQPGSEAWNPDSDPSLYQITHRGSVLGGTNVDDLIVHRRAASQLWYYTNPGNDGLSGVFDSHEEIAKPTCGDPAQRPACAGYAADWSTTTQVISIGDPATSNLSPEKRFLNRSGLITVETGSGGRGALWYYPTVGYATLGTPVRLAAQDWENRDLVPSGDWAGQGHPGMWARLPNGDLCAYTFSYTPPSTATPYPVVTGIASSTIIKTGVTKESWPRIGSDGDLTGSGNPSLWGITPGKDIQVWTGHPTGTTVPGYTFDTVPATVLKVKVGADRWQMNKASFDPQSGATDTLGTNAAGATGTVSWSADHANTADGATNLNGTYFKTAAPSVDTSKSYTVAAWVKVDNLGTYQTFVTQNGNERGSYYLQYSAAYQTWAFVAPGSDQEQTNYYYHAQAATAPQTGVWTHLVGTYDDTTRVMTLYVNGRYSGAGSNPTPWNATGSTTIGIAATARFPADSAASGAVSEVRTYPYALTAQQALALYTG